MSAGPPELVLDFTCDWFYDVCVSVFSDRMILIVGVPCGYPRNLIKRTLSYFFTSTIIKAPFSLSFGNT